MAVFSRGDVHLRYEVLGEGPPVLLIAPGGMFSEYDKWNAMPWNPLTELPANYTVVAMDQRNSGGSSAPITADDTWATMTTDQLALMDHLGHERFAAIGMCIGGPYIANLCLIAPDRITASVLFQPIGLDDNRQAFHDMFDGWMNQIAGDHPEADQAAFDSFRTNLYGGDFLFNTDHAGAASITTPTMLLMGEDLYHPESTSRELAGLLPNVTFIEDWKHGTALAEASSAIHGFLAEHASGPAPAG